MKLNDFEIILISSSNQLRAQRTLLNLTQQEVASRASIPLQSYQQFENGSREISRASFRLACRVFEALKLNPISFYNGEYFIISERSANEKNQRISKQLQ